uniref:Transmembrane protein 220 n=1 Tax=Callorhinchus milii TaxID=7868 RepID=A0A4W3HIA5_CALMI
VPEPGRGVTWVSVGQRICGHCHSVNMEPYEPLPALLWRLCALCMSAFFSLAAGVQINDPDAGMWIIAYLIPAGLAFLVSVNPSITENFMWKSLSEMHLLMCSAVAVLCGWSLYHNAKNSLFHEEEGRELLGLVLIVFWILLCRQSGKHLGAFRVSVAVCVTALPFLAWLYYYINKDLRASWPSHCKGTI